MPTCHLCRSITDEDCEPCPNDPPCKPENICGYLVTRCEHKQREDEEERDEEDDAILYADNVENA